MIDTEKEMQKKCEEYRQTGTEKQSEAMIRFPAGTVPQCEASPSPNHSFIISAGIGIRQNG